MKCMLRPSKTSVDMCQSKPGGQIFTNHKAWSPLSAVQRELLHYKIKASGRIPKTSSSTLQAYSCPKPLVFSTKREWHISESSGPSKGRLTCVHQLVLKSLQTRVWWEIEAVKASAELSASLRQQHGEHSRMRLGQVIWVASLLDGEATRTITAL